MNQCWYYRGLAVLAAGAVLFQINSTPVHAAESKTPPEAKAEAGARRPAPYRGKIASVDLDAKTVTLAGKVQTRTLIVTAQTRIHRDGQPAVLADAKNGEEVAGQCRRTEDGRLEAVSMRLGPKPPVEERRSRKAKAAVEK